jgi:flavorubredoxin
MSDAFKAVPIADRVWWVGAIDRSIRDFHGYATRQGTTYNAYLVQADPVVLIDTVKAPFMDEMLARIASVVDPAKIRYIVSNHAEMDHSGGLPRAVDLIRPEKVFASANGVKALEAQFHWGRAVEAVKDGQELRLGDAALRFLETRMLHWPDSMMTYLVPGDVLFSQDGFGMHLASVERFADQIPTDVLYAEAAKYYANILLPLSSFVTKLLARVAEMNLAPKIIAPDHGPVYRKDPGWIVKQYAKWAAQKPTRKAVVAFDTMWGSTEAMARAIGEGLAAGGASPVRLLPMHASHRSDVAAELLEAGALVAGSPTLNNTIFPTMGDLLAYLGGLRRVNLVGAAFGSYGWSGEAVGRIEERLKAMEVEIVADALKVPYVPDSSALDRCRALGSHVAAVMKGRAAAAP